MSTWTELDLEQLSWAVRLTGMGVKAVMGQSDEGDAWFAIVSGGCDNVAHFAKIGGSYALLAAEVSGSGDSLGALILSFITAYRRPADDVLDYG